MSIQSTGLSDDEKAASPLAGYFTDKQLAEILRRTPRTLARWRAEGKLPFTRLGGKTPLSSPAHLQQMLDSGEVGVRRRRK
jgi:hypothetical protein